MINPLTQKEDWTIDPESGRANSSLRFRELSAVVAQLIRDSAHSIVCGHTEAVGGLIIAQLTHVHGLVPREDTKNKDPRDEQGGATGCCPYCGCEQTSKCCQYGSGFAAGIEVMRDAMILKLVTDAADDIDSWKRTRDARLEIRNRVAQLMIPGSPKKCTKECGLVMHMTGGYHRTDCDLAGDPL
jgi:hypothetical protein